MAASSSRSSSLSDSAPSLDESDFERLYQITSSGSYDSKEPLQGTLKIFKKYLFEYLKGDIAKPSRGMLYSMLSNLKQKTFFLEKFDLDKLALIEKDIQTNSSLLKKCFPDKEDKVDFITRLSDFDSSAASLSIIHPPSMPSIRTGVSSIERQSIEGIEGRGHLESRSVEIHQQALTFLQEKKWNEALTCFEQAVDLARESKSAHITVYQTDMLRCLIHYGDKYLAENKLSDALSCFKNATMIAQEIKSEDIKMCQGHVALCLYKQGLEYFKQSNWSAALPYYEKAAMIAQEIKSEYLRAYQREVAICLHRQASEYFKKSNWSAALPYYEKAAMIAQEIKSEDVKSYQGHVALCLFEQGSEYFENSNWSDALLNFAPAVSIAREIESKELTKYQKKMVETCYHLACEFDKKDDSSAALEKFGAEASALIRKISHKMGLVREAKMENERKGIRREEALDDDKKDNEKKNEKLKYSVTFLKYPDQAVELIDCLDHISANGGADQFLRVLNALDNTEPNWGLAGLLLFFKEEKIEYAHGNNYVLDNTSAAEILSEYQLFKKAGLLNNLRNDVYMQYLMRDHSGKAQDYIAYIELLHEKKIDIKGMYPPMASPWSLADGQKKIAIVELLKTEGLYDNGAVRKLALEFPDGAQELIADIKKHRTESESKSPRAGASTSVLKTGFFAPQCLSDFQTKQLLAKIALCPEEVTNADMLYWAALNDLDTAINILKTPDLLKHLLATEAQYYLGKIIDEYPDSPELQKLCADCLDTLKLKTGSRPG